MNNIDSIKCFVNAFLKTNMSLTHSDDSLTHYASPYYDPIKAHQCYMLKRQLKGRSSSAGLNQKGKEAAYEVKQNLQAEKKAQLAAITSQAKSTKNQAKMNLIRANEVKNSQATAKLNAAIDDFQKELNSMSPKERKNNRKFLMNRLIKLRSTNAELRAKLQHDYHQKYSATLVSLRNTESTLKNKVKTSYAAKYQDELNKIRSDKSLGKSEGSKKTRDKKGRKEEG